MKPGERIRLIKEASDSLAARDKRDIQLILGQHGLSTYDWEQSDPFSPQETVEDYCTDRLGGAKDEVLQAVHEYVTGDDAAPSPSAPNADGLWGSNPVRVFISHCHEDAVFVGNLSRLLRERSGIDAFVAHDQIEPSLVWRDTIRSALNSCDFFVALLHERFHESQWCDQEVGWALGRDVPVMPVRPMRLTSARRDGFLEERQDCLMDESRGASEWWLASQILEQVVRDPRTHTIGVDALIEAFVHSYGYARTRQLWPLIAQEPYLSSDQLRRLEYAVATERQVYDANLDGRLIPDLVAELIRKFEPPEPEPEDPWAAAEPPF